MKVGYVYRVQEPELRKDATRKGALTLLALAGAGELTHFLIVFAVHRSVTPSNIMQWLLPMFAMGVSLFQWSSSADVVERRCWSAVAAAFAIWAGAQALYIYFLYVPPLHIFGVRWDDALWVLFGLPLLLAVHTSHDELDTVQWLDRTQAIFFFVVLYLIAFLRCDQLSLSYVYLIQNVALILCCLLRLPTSTTATERRFFLRLTMFLLVYGLCEALGEYLYRHNWKPGGPADLIWTIPVTCFVVLVGRDRLLAVNKGENTSRLVKAMRRMKGLNIAALTFLTMGISALLASHSPLVGGLCVAACFALFALRTGAREHAWDEAHGQLQQTLLQDALTGLGNRIQLRSSLEIQLTNLPSGHRAALLFVDLDRFKNVNDSLGHAAGDDLLIEVANRLRTAAPPASLVCRIGGDEFVVLASVKSSQEAQDTGETLLTSLRKPMELRGHLLRCTASIGVVLASPGEDIDDLIRTADQAMYRAKQLGKNRVQVFDAGVLEKINSRWRLEADLRASIDRDEIQIAFQPIFSVEGGKIDGFEALARWLHPERGQVPPSDFIPLAEDTGLILKLGAQLMEKACAQVARWNREWGTAFSISVNVSPRQFTEAGFVALVLSTLERTGLAPSLLRLEITESVLVVNENTVHGILSELRTHGILISLDDFGTGYSSLSFLLNLPVDEVKVDRSFVSDMHRDPQRRALVQTVVQLGQSLGKRVVAEGVETEQELCELASMGCESAQGWYVSRPLLPEALEADLAAIMARSVRSAIRSPRTSRPLHATAGRGAWHELLATTESLLQTTP